MNTSLAMSGRGLRARRYAWLRQSSRFHARPDCFVRTLTRPFSRLVVDDDTDAGRGRTGLPSRASVRTVRGQETLLPIPFI